LDVLCRGGLYSRRARPSLIRRGPKSTRQRKRAESQGSRNAWEEESTPWLIERFKSRPSHLRVLTKLILCPRLSCIWPCLTTLSCFTLMTGCMTKLNSSRPPCYIDVDRLEQRIPWLGLALGSVAACSTVARPLLHAVSTGSLRTLRPCMPYTSHIGGSRTCTTQRCRGSTEICRPPRLPTLLISTAPLFAVEFAAENG
jgi:hypothetical protein